MKNSGIEWCDDTYNPIRLKSGGFYCAKVSPACTNCYAEIMAKRFAAMKGVPYEPYTNRKVFPEMELLTGMIDGWKHKKHPKRNFVTSMTDIFGEFVPDWMILAILDAEAAAPLQIFQNLTKRGKRCLEIVTRWLRINKLDKVPDHMWFGFTIENQEEADKRLDFLMEIPAKVLFVSCEPMLSAINLEKWLYSRYEMGGERHMYQKLSWVICGGESGNAKGVRPMHPQWARSLQYQCYTAGVAFFMKQWGTFGEGSDHNSNYKHFVVFNDGTYKPFCSEAFDHGKKVEEWYKLQPTIMRKCGKHLSGALLNGKEYKEFPE